MAFAGSGSEVCANARPLDSTKMTTANADCFLMSSPFGFAPPTGTSSDGRAFRSRQLASSRNVTKVRRTRKWGHRWDPKLQASEETHIRKVLLVLSVIALATTAHVAPTMLHRWRRSVATRGQGSQRGRRTISRRPLSSAGLRRLHDGFVKLVAHSSVSRRGSTGRAMTRQMFTWPVGAIHARAVVETTKTGSQHGRRAIRDRRACVHER